MTKCLEKANYVNVKIFKMLKNKVVLECLSPQNRGKPSPVVQENN